MCEDNISIKWNLERETPGFIGETVLVDNKPSGFALLNSENPRREGDVLQLHIMKEGSQVNAEYSAFWNCIWGTERRVGTFQVLKLHLFDLKNGGF